MISGRDATDHPPWEANEVVDRLHRVCMRYLNEGPTSAQSAPVLSTFLTEIDAIRAAHRQYDALTAQLYTICQVAAPEKTRFWCEKYTSQCSRDMATMEAIVEVLRDGYGRCAAVKLRDFLREPSRVRDHNELVRALRLFAGVLAPREGNFDEAEELLERWEALSRQGWGADAPPDAKFWLLFWIDLLKAKIRYHRARTEGETRGVRKERDLPAFRSSDESVERRVRGWKVSLEFMFKMAGGHALPPQEILNAAQLIHGCSSPESCFGALVLARAQFEHALVAGNEDERVESFRCAMHSVTLSAHIAAIKRLPHEYAAALAVAAALVRGVFAPAVPTGSGRIAPGKRDHRPLMQGLRRRGADVDECLSIATECALRAAELYQWLDVPERCHKALLMAADCLLQCDSPEKIRLSFRWWALARVHRMLPWEFLPRPPGMDASDKKVTAFAAPRIHVKEFPDEKTGTDKLRYFDGSSVSSTEGPRLRLADTRRRRDEQSLFTRAMDRWKGGAKRAPDPGEDWAVDFYDIFGPGLNFVFQARSVSVERIQGNVPDLGCVLREILAQGRELRSMGRSVRSTPPGGNPRHRLGRVLDLGCGSGVDAVQLSHEGVAKRVLGMDASPWNVLSAERLKIENQAKLDGSVRFLHRELTAVDPRKLGEGRFDYVLLRDALLHVTQKDRVIKLAYACLKPGGVLLCVDWIARRTPSMSEWQRLMDMAWLTDLRTEQEYVVIALEAGFEKVSVIQRNDWMHDFFENRLTQLPEPMNSEDEVLLARAKRDLEALRDMSGDGGPLGWLFLCARKPGGGRERARPGRR